MSGEYSQIPLGEILTRSEAWIALQPDCEYRQITVRLWGKGVALRDVVPGASIAAERRIVARTGQFIMSRIDARNGAFGIVPPALDGAVVSTDFPIYGPNLQRILPTYLGWLSRTPRLMEICQAASEGTTNRIRLKEDRFLAATVPLPPLPEQRRIVARIEELAAKIEEARGLRQEADSDCDALFRSFLFGAANTETASIPMQELVKLREPDVVVRADEMYHFAGVYCFGKGVFAGQRKAGMEFSYPRLTRLRANDFVYPKLMAWEGALGVVPRECAGLVVSTEFPVFEVNRDRALPETLDVYFRTPEVWPRLSGASTGTNVRRRRLNPIDFLRFKMPLPSMETQLRLRQIKADIDATRPARLSLAAELDALLPSILDRAFSGAL